MTNFSVLNPSTGENLEHIQLAGVADVDRAVDAALEAQQAWSRTAPAERARILRAIGDAIDGSREELALLETRNVGKPISESLGEVDMAAQVFHYYSGAIEKHFGHTIPVAGGLDYTLNVPLGVIGVIVPWNFPLAIATWNVAPALACGNAVVLKPSELTPLTAVRLEQIAIEAGLSEGLLSVVVGTGDVAGMRLVTHPDIAKISFTGSTPVGKRIMVEAAATLKRLTLELGGKAANIVFADANIDAAAREAVPAVFGNSGQDCCSRSRILVEHSALDEFTDKFLTHAQAFTVGDPEDPATCMGPVVSAVHRDRVASFIDDNADVAFRGSTPEGGGFWFPPTVILAPAPDSRLVRDEIFGPVATISGFSSEEEAVQLGNANDFGLSGSVWTENGAKAHRVARDLQAGVVSVNSNNAVRVATPFGGFKQSGFGRELGMEAMNSYTELKNVFMKLD